MRKKILEQELRQHEAVIGKQIGQETIQVFDTQGRIINLIHGGYDNEIAPSVYNKWNNCIMIHNHPRGWNYPANDPRRGGNSFSLGDIMTACRARLKEIRAITPKFRYIAKLNGKDEKYFAENIIPLYIKYRSEVNRFFLSLDITSRNALNPDYWHLIWDRVFRSLDIEYKREEL